MPLKDLEDLKELLDKGVPHPQQVEIVGTTFGNVLQNRINTKLAIANLLLLYLCVIATIELYY